MARPRKQIDLDQLRQCALIHCTMEEIGRITGVSVATLERRYADIIKDARATGKMSLRRALWKSALGGNTGAQVWLSKNELGYRDRFEQSTAEDIQRFLNGLRTKLAARFDTETTEAVMRDCVDIIPT